MALLFALAGCKQSNGDQAIATTPKKENTPKNIILMIADGTGLSQISAAQYYKEGPSNYDRFPVVGLSKTSSSIQLITDSAAGATAMASGVKTYNGAIGVDNDTIKVVNIAEEAGLKGLSTGLVATSSITHATPACFYSHVMERDLQYDIAAQMVGSTIDYFAAAGTKYFVQREDGRNLIDELTQEGFHIDTTALNRAPDATKVGYLLAPEEMPKAIEGRGDFLQAATQIGIERLGVNENGFFFMVEGSQIDWGGHDNDAAYLIGEMVDFDDAIGVALDFAEKDGNTLVIVTADHETGGFTLGAKERTDYAEIDPTFSTDSHSATMVPVFAYGPGAEDFGGIYQNTAIYHKMKALLLD